tara:strand:- start:539 stop:799 length:261 start_codon:yes stop_codon:yes gene_type:complete
MIKKQMDRRFDYWLYEGHCLQVYARYEQDVQERTDYNLIDLEVTDADGDELECDLKSLFVKKWGTEQFITVQEEIINMAEDWAAIN